jgi:hypothetical protein
MKMEQIECSETSAYKIQTPGNHPEENIQMLIKLSMSIVLCYIIICYGQNHILCECETWSVTLREEITG